MSEPLIEKDSLLKNTSGVSLADVLNDINDRRRKHAEHLGNNILVACLLRSGYFDLDANSPGLINLAKDGDIYVHPKSDEFGVTMVKSDLEPGFYIEKGGATIFFESSKAKTFESLVEGGDERIVSGYPVSINNLVVDSADETSKLVETVRDFFALEQVFNDLGDLELHPVSLEANIARGVDGGQSGNMKISFDVDLSKTLFGIKTVVIDLQLTGLKENGVESLKVTLNSNLLNPKDVREGDNKLSLRIKELEDEWVKSRDRLMTGERLSRESAELKLPKRVEMNSFRIVFNYQ